VFDLLAYLVENRERVLSKDDLIAAVWGGRIVSDAALTTRLNAARSAITDSGQEQRLIKTLPRKGVRFVGAVREEQAPAGEVQLDGRSVSRPIGAVADRPSIAVLPFANMSGEPEQDYFADGITDDIITELSRFPELLVIARNSSFQYKGKSVDVRHIGRELGVLYVLEGSVRRSGDRIRIVAQLVDAQSGAHRWAERYDRKLADIFAIQDDVVCAIAPVLAAHLTKAEVERTLLKPSSTWQAHDFYLRGLETLRAYLSSYDAGQLHEARGYLLNALSVDPQYARAYPDLSFTYWTAWFNRVDTDFLKPEALERAYSLARKAVEVDPNLPRARAQLGMVLTFLRKHDAAIAEFERAQGLNPNFNDWRFASTLVYAGDAARAIKVADALVRLDPFYVPLAAGFRGFANYMLGRYEPAAASLVEAAGRAPKQRHIRQWLTATYAQLGQLPAARDEAAALLHLEPEFTIKGIATIFSPFRRQRDAEHLFDGLRKAGLPDG
jgi:adenylate cyclase